MFRISATVMFYILTLSNQLPANITNYIRLLLKTEFFGNFGRNSVLMNKNIHRFISHIGFGGIEHTIVFTVIAPRVLDHKIFVTFVIFSYTVDDHTMIIGSFPISLSDGVPE